MRGPRPHPRLRTHGGKFSPADQSRRLPFQEPRTSVRGVSSTCYHTPRMSSCEPLSLYLHIPFCYLKCRYCDFNSYAGLEELVEPYVDALIQEMALWSGFARGRPVPTVFFGGGLPRLLAAGVNRISFGVQSFFDDELAALDRIHSAAEAEEAYGWAREAGFRRVNLDLIYGLPQTGAVGPQQPFDGAQDRPMERWQASLE